MQIAGLIARRIVCFVQVGQAINTGERFGMIRFGSRLDVYLPEGTPPLVAVGQTSIAAKPCSPICAAPVKPGHTGRADPARLSLDVAIFPPGSFSASV